MKLVKQKGDGMGIFTGEAFKRGVNKLKNSRPYQSAMVPFYDREAKRWRAHDAAPGELMDTTGLEPATP